MNEHLLGGRGPQRLLTITILLSTVPFLAVALFKQHLYHVMDSPSYLVFHNVTEFFSVMVSLSIFGLGWCAFGQNKDRHSLFLSVAFLAIGLMDFMHTLGYSGMPALITLNTPNKSSQFWIAVRFFGATAFLASAFVYPDMARRWLSKTCLMVTALSVVSMVFVGVTFFPDHVPSTFIQGIGLTPFKIGAEYVIILLLCLASLMYWRRLSQTGDRQITYYLAAFVLCIFSELVFAIYNSVFDTYNVLGHAYKIIAFGLIYKGIFVASVRKPYEALLVSNDDLRMNRNMLSHIMNSIPQAIFWKDRESIYLGCNQVFANQAGIVNPDEICGKSDFDLPWTRDEAEGYRADDRDVMESSQEKHHILETIRKSNDSVRWIDTTKIPLTNSSGTVIGVLGVYEDVTSRKKAEEELEQYREHLEVLVEERTSQLEVAVAKLSLARDAANAANHAKSMFLANMSHEIRTPMNAVLGFAQLLQRDPSLSPAARNKVVTIMKSGEHLLSIINDILEMSRIEAGRAEMHPQAVDLHVLLDDLTSMFRLRAEEKGLSFTLDAAPDLSRNIVTDLGKLRQVLINLLGNAVKFTKTGSIVLRAFPAGIDRIAIEVQDSGIGIAVMEQEKLFQAFERTRSGEQTAGGTGLGLAISREYAHLMDGEITFESVAHEGSCFRFEFHAPVTSLLPVSSKTPRHVVGLAPGQGEIRILVVDDQGTNRELLRGMLEAIGFVVDEASDGEDAIEKIHALKPRVVLMDLVMPGMDGIEATHILRRTRSTASLVIIGVTASAFEQDRQHFLDSGINAYMTKPFKEQELYDLLAEHAGICFETAEHEDVVPMQHHTELPTLAKLSPEWREAFRQALSRKNITRIRKLGEEAQESDPLLSSWILERAALYDLDGMKKLEQSP